MEYPPYEVVVLCPSCHRRSLWEIGASVGGGKAVVYVERVRGEPSDPPHRCSIPASLLNSPLFVVWGGLGGYSVAPEGVIRCFPQWRFAAPILLREDGEVLDFVEVVGKVVFPDVGEVYVGKMRGDEDILLVGAEDPISGVIFFKPVSQARYVPVEINVEGEYSFTNDFAEHSPKEVGGVVEVEQG